MYPYNLEPSEIKIMADEKKGKADNLQMADKKILDMLLLALKDESKDQNYYEQLSKKVDNKEDAKILRQISLDEQKHYKYFAQIYKRLTGKNPSVQFEKAEVGNNIVGEFAQAIFEELGAVEFYLRLMFLFLDLQIRDMIYEIITDEQAHASKLNYLYSKYNVMENEKKEAQK